MKPRVVTTSTYVMEGCHVGVRHSAKQGHYLEDMQIVEETAHVAQ